MPSDFGSAPRRADPVAGALAGFAAGLAAAFAVKHFEALWKSLAPREPGDARDPPNVEAASAVVCAAGGRRLADRAKDTGGTVVHYAMGAALGVVYGVAAEYWPRIRTGHGTAFGLVSALALEDALVPAAGLSEPPWRSSIGAHARGLAAHLVFGAVAEGARSRLRALALAGLRQIPARRRRFPRSSRPPAPGRRHK